MFSLSDLPLAIPAELTLNPHAGGVVTFAGHVRDQNEGKVVTAIDYEAYQALAESEGNAIMTEAMDKFGLYDVQALHRTGFLRIGDMAIWVYVTAMHRREAFQAAEYIVHEIKHRVPIWKKEYYADGASAWVRCTHHTN
jgi:molybdopterin synthase catalytic subunit